MENQKKLSSFQIVKKAFEDTNTHFKMLALNISFSLLVTTSAFVPMWVWYFKSFPKGSMMVTMFEVIMVFSLLIVALFMTSLILFNKIQSPKPPLGFWSWTKEITWPWTIEGLKALIIIIAGLIAFVIPGIIKCVHYMFFHLVVFFNPDYKEGKINCLKHSKSLSEGLEWWILGLFVILPHFIGELPRQTAKIIFEQTDSLFIIYPVLMTSCYVMSLGGTYLFSMMYFMYFLKEKEVQSQRLNS